MIRTAPEYATGASDDEHDERAAASREGDGGPLMRCRTQWPPGAPAVAGGRAAGTPGAPASAV